MAEQNLGAFIWSVADLLRGDYKQSEYGRVILPFTVIRRLDCVLEATKPAVLSELATKQSLNLPLHAFLTRASGYGFYNTSELDFKRLQSDSSNIGANIISYVNAFSENVRDVFERYDFAATIAKLDSNNLLYRIVQKFASIDLHPDAVSNSDMGLVFEELIRKFSELSNETAGEHFTPREVIRLMVSLLFDADDDVLAKSGVVRTLYDPTAGTGGMLSVADEHLRTMNPDARLVMYGQELNPESYAICKADMLIKGQDIGNIVFGNTLSADAHGDKRFDYMLSNPPFGVEWKKVETEVRDEHQRMGYAGRFGVGLPRVSDGSLLFLLHLISKMRPVEQGGSRLAIVLNGSPLFTGGAGSGESNIRKWIIENDWLEAIVALPTDMFYNTGINTYVWIVTNHKAPERQGKVQLINAVDLFQKMRKSLGSKRKELGAADIQQIVREYGDFETTAISKLFDNNAFGYTTITVERPLRLNWSVNAERLQRVRELPVVLRMKQKESDALMAALGSVNPETVWRKRDKWNTNLKKVLRTHGVTLTAAQVKAVSLALSERDPTADICLDSKGNTEADPELRDTENVPLADSIEEFFKREVLPHLPDAWIDPDKNIVGYEIPFTRHFYKYVAPRNLAEIDADLKTVTGEIQRLLQEIVA